ncbi:MAG: PD-(D/E)XK nuclease family protein [Bacilli bacterium]|nr:PD-(D/E)XK nuclease family protein [Bacilli bacterium]
MLLDNILHDNSILVIPNNIKKTVLEEINNLDKIYNIKIMSKEELLNTITFNYDEKTICYLMSKFKYDIALMYLNNLKYIDNKNYNNSKLDFLVEMKNELDENNLLIYNELFKSYLKNKEIIIYGYDYLNNYEKKILSDYNYKFIKLESNNYKHTIYEFKNINEEIEYVASRIVKLIKSGIDINHIKIANINEEYNLAMTRIFKMYNIPLANIVNDSIYTTSIIRNFLKNFDLNSITINDEVDQYIYDKLIGVLNKYYFVKDYSSIKELLIIEFKNIKNKTIKYKKEIEIIDLNNNIISDNDYVFYMNFNQGYAPIIVKDEDYLSDKDKIILGLETKDELNKINKEILINKLNSIKNLEITYKLKSSTGDFEVSCLIDDLDYETVKNHKIENIYSHKMNRIKLSLMLDELVKYQNINDDLNILFNTYKDLPYAAYDNSFKGVIKEDFNRFIDNELYLSYSSLDNYYKCGFRFYLNNILKINKNEDKFVTTIGNIFHEVLEQAFKDNFDFDSCFKKTIENYEINNKEQFFLIKLKEDLKFIINTINKQNRYSSLDKSLYEQNVFVNKDNNIKITFTGKIDKLLYKEIDGYNYVVIIDYKTGNPDVNLNNTYYGLSMQLPIYVYLANNIKEIKNVKVIGFYLQKILHKKPNKDSKKDLIALKENELKLDGYTNSNLEYVSLFDNNYTDTKVIKGFSIKADGTINAKSKVLSDLEINNLIKLTDRKINEAITNITNTNFAINPKQIDNENVSCKYCKYQDICFKKNDNLEYLTKKDYKEFLKEGE